MWCLDLEQYPRNTDTLRISPKQGICDIISIFEKIRTFLQLLKPFICVKSARLIHLKSLHQNTGSDHISTVCHGIHDIAVRPTQIM